MLAQFSPPDHLNRLLIDEDLHCDLIAPFALETELIPRFFEVNFEHRLRCMR